MPVSFHSLVVFEVTGLTHVVTESTNNKMFYWSVLEAMALLSVSLLQVYTIRRFFNNPARVRV